MPFTGAKHSHYILLSLKFEKVLACKEVSELMRCIITDKTTLIALIHYVLTKKRAYDLQKVRT